jgi:hypothetical protein
MAKRVGMVTELDEALMAWLEGHHIRPKDVRAWGTEGRASDLTILTLEVIVSGVDEIGPVPRIEFRKDITPEEVAEFKERFLHAQKCGRPFGHTGEHWPPGGTHPAPSDTTFWPGPGEPGHVAQERIDLTGWSEAEIDELHRTGVPPESRR